MGTTRRGLLANWPLVCLLVVVGINALALSGELGAGRFAPNDSVLHYTLTDSVVQSIERGQSPLDFWASEWSLGYAVPRTYQMLGHVAIAFLYFMLGKSVSILTLFTWVRFLAIALLPVSVYVSARRLMLSATAGLAAAALSPLISTNNLYGLEYGSFLWRGNGLFTQAIAMHLLLLAVGYSFQVIRGNSRAAIGGLLLGLTFLSHFVYGFIGALSIALLALIPDTTPVRKRLVRLAVLGGVTFASVAFQLIPMLLDSRFVNHSRWEAPWKWDSFGASAVVHMLLHGDLFDFGRLPLLSVLALFGAVVCVVKWRQARDQQSAFGTPATTYAFLLSGTVLWLLLFCGRPAWGVVFTMLGANELPLHRLVGGVHFFAFFLIGIGLDAIWTRCLNLTSKYRKALAVGLTVVLLFPALKERATYLRLNAEWSEDNLSALRAEEHDVDTAVAAVDPDGRAYAGLAATWGSQFKIGSVPFYAILSVRHIPAVAFLYHSMALTSDLMVWFNDTDPAHYRLFNVGDVIAPDSHPVAPFLIPKTSIGRFRLYKTPANGYFDVVRVPYAARVYADNFYDLNYTWLTSPWVSRLDHLLLDMDGATGLDLPRLGYRQPLPDIAEARLGEVVSAKRDGETYQADVELQQPGYLLFKMTYHPNWMAVIDGGSPQRTVMLTPGFIGVKLGPGRHLVQLRYQPGPLKTILLLVGLLFVLAIAVAERAGAVEWGEDVIGRAMRALKTPVKPEFVAAALTFAGLVALSMPVAVPLLTNQLVSGHDAFVYVPRLVEFHENVRHWVLLPRWAPDLGAGHGQPWFVFNPPLLYYVAEVWYLLGFEATTAYNLVSVTIILASAVFMYALGKLYFGRPGGWLAAAAYIYAPYFHVDVYVRQALAEFAAFPFYPLALYGFGRFARDRDRTFLIVGAAGIAGVFVAHNAAALLFVPIVALFVLYNAWSRHSWRLLVESTAGLVLGVSLSAFVWMPALFEVQHVHIERVLEGYLNYSNHAVYPAQFLSTFWGYGLSVRGTGDGMSFSLGWSHVLLLVAALIAMQRPGRKHVSGVPTLFAGLVVAACFLMTPGAMWIWDRLRLLQFVEFPWRILGPVAACLAVVVGSLPVLVEGVRHRTGLALVLALIIVPNLAHIRAERYYPLTPSDWTPDQIAARAVSVATNEEYEPSTVRERPAFESERLRVLSGRAIVSHIETSPAAWSGQIAAESDSVLEARLSYFPGWIVEIDGRQISYVVGGENGQIQFTVPAGSHRVRLEFRRTRVQLAADVASAFGWLGSLGFLFLTKF
jgi:hypothetical protein